MNTRAGVFSTAAQIKAEIFDIAAADGGGKEALRLAARASAERMVARGVLRGYLAYENGLAVGWCNANEKSRYVRVGEFDPADSESGVFLPTYGSPRIKSIVCFEIAPAWRGRGIAAALLEKVCRDAKRDGYAIAEAYPLRRERYEPLDFSGPMHLYEKAGFTPAGQLGRLTVMQKKLL